MAIIRLSLALVVGCILLGTAAAFSKDALVSEFTQWAQANQKTYSTDEFIQRWEVWRGNRQYIEHHNRQNKSFVLAMNKFGDLTNQEFKQMFNGLNYNHEVNTMTHMHSAIVPPQLRDLPASFDWRTKGAVAEVKDQGQCGSCWSFSATGSTEGAHFLKTGELVSLSEQNLVDCSSSYGNMGCNGGLMDYAFQYIIDNKGIDTEKSYPYKAVDGTCAYNAANIGATLTKFTDVKAGDEKALLAAVAIEPTSVAIDAGHSSFQFYKSGVYYEANCSPTQLDHGVLAVGWGSEAGSDYWIVKNSWGADWGTKGYLLMSRNRDNNCGIATAASYPTA